MSTRQSRTRANRVAGPASFRRLQHSAIALSIAALLSANAYAQEPQIAQDNAGEKKKRPSIWTLSSSPESEVPSSRHRISSVTPTPSSIPSPR